MDKAINLPSIKYQLGEKSCIALKVLFKNKTISGSLTPLPSSVSKGNSWLKNTNVFLKYIKDYSLGYKKKKKKSTYCLRISYSSMQIELFIQEFLVTGTDCLHGYIIQWVIRSHLSEIFVPTQVMPATLPPVALFLLQKRLDHNPCVLYIQFLRIKQWQGFQEDRKD